MVRVERVAPVDRQAVAATVPAAPVSVPAGYPSPAQDYYDGPIDLTEHLIKDSAARFIVRVSGESMREAGISDGDELIVDRSMQPQDSSVVVAVLDGELTVKRLRITTSGVVLQADNAQHPDLQVGELSDLQIWGVVVTCIHAVA